MVDVYVLDENLNLIGIIDTYSSLIWANRYKEDGDCELYIEATTENFSLLKKNYYLYRQDDEMVCQIKKIELDTDTENGNYIIATGKSVTNFLNQRIIWGTSSVNGNVEQYIRKNVENALGASATKERQFKSEDGTIIFRLGQTANLTDVAQEQNSYTNLGELIREKCQKYGWGYKVIMIDNIFYFMLYKGTDRSDSVFFAPEYENINSSKYVEDAENVQNVALVCGEGEGSERIRDTSGYAEGINRYELYVDAKDISKTVKWSELIELYPLKTDGGQGYITTEDKNYVYKMEYIDIVIHDKTQLSKLESLYQNGTIITINNFEYYRIKDVIIANLKNNEMQDEDDVILRDVVYTIYLITRGYEKLAEYGITKSFEGSIEADTTFKFKKDYFLGDIVTVKNEYGISEKARIIEVIETFDDNGKSIEPKFEYMEEK